MKTLEQLAKKDIYNTVTKKDGTLKKRVKEALNRFGYGTGKKIYFSYYTGKGRYIRLVTYQYEIDCLLRLSGYKFKLTNDAVRGGAQGDHYVVSEKCREFLNSLK